MTQVKPNHIAIIMDGNGRFAKEKNKSRIFGHRAGYTSVLKTVIFCRKLDIKSLTLYAFSSENWARPESEVNSLMRLFSQAIRHNKRLFLKHQIRFNVIGDIDKFSLKLQKQIKELEKETSHFQKMNLNIAANYGGKWDITQSCKLIATKINKKELTIHDINENLINEHLSIKDNIDLLIRTGGEIRISNFLLWQCAYAEFFFLNKFWPEFSETDLEKVLFDYSKRQRRFGGL